MSSTKHRSPSKFLAWRYAQMHDFSQKKTFIGKGKLLFDNDPRLILGRNQAVQINRTIPLKS